MAGLLINGEDMKKVKKIAITVIPVILTFFSLSAPSYAIDPQRFGAWIASALTAINIVATSATMPIADLSRDFNDWLSYPVKVVANNFIEVPYTTPIEAIDEYLERSTLIIDKDKVVIDGVEYTDVWLSTDAAEQFRLNAFDIQTAYSIASQSNGTFVDGYCIDNGVRFYTDGVTVFTQGTVVDENTIWGPYQFVYSQGTARPYRVYYTGGYFSLTDPFPWTVSERGNYKEPTTTVRLNRPVNGVWTALGSPYRTITKDPFEFDWVAGTVPADEPLTDEGLRIRVPTEELEPWYTDYPATGDSEVINLGNPTLEQKVDDLIDLIIPLIPILDIDFEEYNTPAPAPDPEPVPDPEPYPDPLPDPSISLIDSTLKDIVQALKNLYDNISIGNSMTEAIKNLSDKIKWTLDEIKEAIGDLTSKIVSGNADWFRDIVDSIWQPFLPILNIFRAGVGIWHHVVDWLDYIHEPFVTFWNFLGSAGYIFVSPIFASAAGAIVIAIYRRFGR